MSVNALTERTSMRPELVRGIGRWMAVALMVNGIVGAGIFGLPSRLHGLAGVHALWAFVVCASAVGAVALCFAEVSSRFTATGGPYLYARETFGPLGGFVIGWTQWLTRAASIGVIVNVTADYAAFFWPALASGPWRAALLTTLIGGFAIVNVAGVRNAAGACTFFTVAKLVPLVGFVALGAFFLDPGRLVPAQPFVPGPVIAATVQLLFAFSGFEAVSVLAGEMREPERNVPFATLTAVAGVAVLYFAIQMVCIGTLPDLASSSRPLADASSRILGPVGGAAMSVGAILSTVGTMGGTMLGGSRVFFAMAQNGQLPEAIAAIHPGARTPHVAIVLTATLGLTLALTGSFAYLLALAVISRLLAYAATSMALPILRRRRGTAPFRVPAGDVVAALGVAASVAMIVNGGLRPLRDVAIAIAAGLIFHGAQRWRARRHGR